jgi:hypothetical protein
MKTNELRIGNFINHEDFNVPMMVSGVLLDDNRIRVAAIGGQSTVMVGGSWSPIPLTLEWLVKLNFVVGWIISHNEKYFNLFKVGDEYFYSADQHHHDSNGIKYVHQLQNLFFAHKNEELTIK